MLERLPALLRVGRVDRLLQAPRRSPEPRPANRPGRSPCPRTRPTARPDAPGSPSLPSARSRGRSAWPRGSSSCRRRASLATSGACRRRSSSCRSEAPSAGRGVECSATRTHASYLATRALLHSRSISARPTNPNSNAMTKTGAAFVTGIISIAPKYKRRSRAVSANLRGSRRVVNVSGRAPPACV